MTRFSSTMPVKAKRYRFLIKNNESLTCNIPAWPIEEKILATAVNSSKTETDRKNERSIFENCTDSNQKYKFNNRSDMPWQRC